MLQPVIVFQSDSWVLLSKPEGYSVTQLAEAYRPFFTNFHPVHRLDKDTSGLWLVATTAAANARLSQAFLKRQVTKYYLAVCLKAIKKKQGWIIGDMDKSRRSQWRLLRSQENPARTQFFSTSLSQGLRLLLLRPITGKTHQIRVAMKSNGQAVLGDTIYDKNQSADYSRLFLHAYYLAFEDLGEQYCFSLLPATGEHFQGEAFNEALAVLQLQAGIVLHSENN